MSDGKLLESKIVDADQMAKEFKEHSVAEFFKKNKQMLGLYGKVRTLTTVIHEYVSNSIDGNRWKGAWAVACRNKVSQAYSKQGAAGNRCLRDYYAFPDHDRQANKSYHRHRERQANKP